LPFDALNGIGSATDAGQVSAAPLATDDRPALHPSVDAPFGFGSLYKLGA
jgi:hypothetical protein